MRVSVSVTWEHLIVHCGVECSTAGSAAEAGRAGRGSRGRSQLRLIMWSCGWEAGAQAFPEELESAQERSLGSLQPHPTPVPGPGVDLRDH